MWKKILFLTLLLFIKNIIFSENPINLTILFTNDTNGHPLSFNYLNEKNVGGIPARASLIKKIKLEKQDHEFLILDSGGIIRGMMESNIFNGEPDIAGMNYCNYFASGVGSSELYYSIDFFKNLNKKAKFYFVCTNIKNKKSPKEEICDKFIIKKIGGKNEIKIGIIGLITHEALDEISETAKEEIVFLDPIETARELVTELKSEKYKVDIIIALTYLGYYPTDDRIGSRSLAASVDGIDIIIDGRTGFKLEDLVVINDTRIVQAYKWGLYLGELNLKILNKKITEFNYKLHPINFGIKEEEFLEEDKECLNKIKSKMLGYNTILKKPIVKVNGEYTSEDVKNKESAIGNLICDALKEYTEADIAFQNAGGIGEFILNKEITLDDINKIIKYDNELITVNILGEELISILENSMKNIGRGSFLQVSGINLIYSQSEKKIKSLLVNGVELKPYSFYKVALNSWLAYGGDGYNEFKEVPYKINYRVMHKEALYQFLIKQKNITPTIGNRIVIE